MLSPNHCFGLTHSCLSWSDSVVSESGLTIVVVLQPNASNSNRSFRQLAVQQSQLHVA